MGEREMNARAGHGCTGCGSKTQMMNRGTSRAYPNNTRMGGGGICGCTGRMNGTGSNRRTSYGMNNGRMNNGRMNNGRMNNTHRMNEREDTTASNKGTACCEMTEKLRKLEFGIVDVALYLNAYPESECALAYYHKLIEERNCLLEKINEECGPMTLYDNRSETCWKWVEGPWPWHIDSN